MLTLVVQVRLWSITQGHERLETHHEFSSDVTMRSYKPVTKGNNKEIHKAINAMMEASAVLLLAGPLEKLKVKSPNLQKNWLSGPVPLWD